MVKQIETTGTSHLRAYTWMMLRQRTNHQDLQLHCVLHSSLEGVGLSPVASLILVLNSVAIDLLVSQITTIYTPLAKL
jgi:hypothetical protein